MALPLLLGIAVIIVNMGVQSVAILALIRYLAKKTINYYDQATFSSDLRVLCSILLLLFAGHLVQFYIWAFIFVLLGEFNSMEVAFYHSMVNFSSLGYGDIVMSERWRLLGALEACNGVLMFSLSAGVIFAIVSNLFRRYYEKKEGE